MKLACILSDSLRRLQPDGEAVRLIEEGHPSFPGLSIYREYKETPPCGH